MESTWYSCMSRWGRSRSGECRKTNSDTKTVSVLKKFRVDVRHSWILYPTTKSLEKAVELIEALDHMKTFWSCFWWGEIKIRTTSASQAAQYCYGRRAERSYTRCKYRHMWLQLEGLKWVIPRSFISKLVLYTSRPFSKFHCRSL